MIVKLLIEHYLEFLSLKGGCRGSSESTLVKMSNCWKSHALAQLSRKDNCFKSYCPLATEWQKHVYVCIRINLLVYIVAKVLVRLCVCTCSHEPWCSHMPA